MAGTSDEEVAAGSPIMKAMVLERFGEPLVRRDVAVPKIGSQDTLIRVGACGLCATDLKIQSGKVPTVKVPHIMGHEIAGVVAEVGAEVATVKPGDRVVVDSYVTCGGCYYCRIGRENLCRNLIGRLGTELDGAYAEYVWAPSRNLCPVPEGVTLEQASICAGAMASPLHALRARARVQSGDVVMILGVGGVGIHALQIAKELGATTVAVDVVPAKLDLARQLGADLAVDARVEPPAEAVRRYTDGEGADVLAVMIGGPALTQAVVDCAAGLRPGGRIVLFGYEFGVPLTLDSAGIVYQEFDIVGSLGHTRQDVADIVRMVGSGRVKPQLGSTYSLPEANEALDALRRSEDAGRLILVP